MSFIDALRRSRAMIDRMDALAAPVGALADDIERAIRAGGKIVFFGNGGSAADSQHLAAEFVVRYRAHRRALPALALTVDASALTAQANDVGFASVFARQVHALCRREDVVIGISTSGRSANVAEGLSAAREIGALGWSWTGAEGGAVAACADKALRIPSDETARVQEALLLVGHWLCEEMDRRFASDAPRDD